MTMDDATNEHYSMRFECDRKKARLLFLEYFGATFCPELSEPDGVPLPMPPVCLTLVIVVLF